MLAESAKHCLTINAFAMVKTAIKVSTFASKSVRLFITNEQQNQE